MGGFVAFGLIAAAALLLGPAGFFMSLGNGQRLAAAEREMRALRARLAEFERRAPIVAPPPTIVTPGSAPIVDASEQPLAAAEPSPVPPPQPTERPEPAALPKQPSALPPEVPPSTTIPVAATEAGRPPKPGRSLEEALGARWTVWVGGVAIALGALLLVRYSIEHGFLGPARGSSSA